LKEELNKVCDRYLAVINPIKLVITNYPENQIEELDAINNPEIPEHGQRKIPFGRELFIEQDDFSENPPPKYFRLTPGQEVRLRYAYFVKCTDVIKDENGNIIEVHCTYDPESKGGTSPDGRKVKGTIHWVSANKAVEAEVRLYDRLFTKENPEDVEEGEDFTVNLNPDSLIVSKAYCEPALAEAASKGEFRCQFERLGYFYTDIDSKSENLIFNRIVTLKDSWTKMQNKNK
jgi:glutaminyl-tRNA synthetase